MTNNTHSIVGLDVGSARIGVAVSSLIARLPQPHGVIANNDGAMKAINDLASNQQAVALVVGLPRGLDGQETEQTKYVRNFVKDLSISCSVPVYFQDEALTSKQAEAELLDQGVRYNKESVDALAATYILSDFLKQHPEVM